MILFKFFYPNIAAFWSKLLKWKFFH